MRLDKIKDNWNKFGAKDPLWAILTHPGKENGNWDNKEFFATGNKVAKEYLDAAAKRNLPSEFRHALDFGCGVGRITLPLSDRFEKVIGVDCAESMIKKANTYNTKPNSAQYLLNEKPDLSIFPDNHFDFVVSVITLQHMPKSLFIPYIHEFVRVLKPGGALMFQLPGVCLDQTVSWRLPTPSFLDKPERALDGPYMEMHGADPDEVVQSVESAGGSMEEVKEWQMGRIWMSYRYLVSKRKRFTDEL